MINQEHCAWVTKDGFCRWHREQCCRTTPGACAACVSRAHSCKEAYCWIKKKYDKRSAKGRMQFYTRDVSGGIVFSQCTGKVRYANEFRAKEIARTRMRNGSAPLRVYHCMFCNGYHLTHKLRHDDRPVAA